MGLLYLTTLTRFYPEKAMKNTEPVSTKPSSSERLKLLDDMLPILKKVSGIITQDCPGYSDDAYSIMIIAVLECKSDKRLTFGYAKRVAVCKLIDEMFRSRKYLFYSHRNKFPTERYEDDPAKYNQEHHYPSPEDVFVADVMIARIFETLNDDEKALLVMNFWGGLTLKSIGGILGKSSSTIRKRRETLFDKIRGMLENDDAKKWNDS